MTLIPPFVSVVNGYWVLSADKWIKPYVEQHKKLNYDQAFKMAHDLMAERKGTVIDVGAFIGDSTAWFCDHPCVTFEPQRDAFTCLCHNIPTGFHLPFPAGNGELVNIQFGEGGNMGGRTVYGKGEMIRTMRIDDLNVQDVGLIKIDVEGWEPKVLDGAKETLAKWKPMVMVEFNKDGLDRHGHSFQDIEYRFQSGWKCEEVFRYDNNQWDVLYIPK